MTRYQAKRSAPVAGRRATLYGLALAALAWGPAVALADELPDLDLEALLQARVIRTPKFAVNAETTPSSISLLTRQDIRTFGWRTLADALRTLNGYTVTNDHTYAYVGVRGVSAPGDYRSRLQLLIDGIPVNENLYGSANIDNSFPLDLDLVDRIEVVRGPSASVYGGDSLFGVINVVTRSGAAVGGTEIAASLGSGRAGELRASWGGLTAGGADVLLSATGSRARGQRSSFPDLAGAGIGTEAEHVEGDRVGKFFGRVKAGGWRATLVHSERDRTVPTGSFATEFNDERHREADIYTLAEVAHDLQLNRSNSVHNRVYGGRYLYEGDFPYVYPPFVKNRDRATGAWWGFESRLLSTAWQGHRWIAGLEYRNNVRQDQRNDDEGVGCFGTGPAPCLEDRRSSRQWSFYAQDEMEVGDNTYLTLGLRRDRLSEMPGHWSPRLGLVRQTAAAGTFKLLYATAFSDPTVYQRFYSTAGFAVGNPGLMPERMKSLDLTWEGQVGPRSRMSASLYFFRVRDMLALDAATTQTRNIPEATARGFEVEYLHHWAGGAAVRAGYTLQSASLAGGSLENMARHALKANLALPLAGEAWKAGLEAQAMSRRRTGMADGRVPGHAVFNANVLHRPAGARWDASLGVYNLTDRKYADPVALDATLGGPRDRMVQLGRTLRLAFSARF